MRAAGAARRARRVSLPLDSVRGTEGPDSAGQVGELDLAGRRCLVKAKGARTKARRRGQSRKDYVLEPVYGDAATARLLLRLLKGRARGPVLITHRRPRRQAPSSRACWLPAIAADDPRSSIVLSVNRAGPIFTAGPVP